METKNSTWVIFFIAILSWAIVFIGLINYRIQIFYSSSTIWHHFYQNDVADNKLVVQSSQVLGTTNWMKQMEDRYHILNENVKKICKKYKKGNYSRVPITNILVDKRNHLAYCPNAKVGSTAWMLHFNNLLPEKERLWDGKGGLSNLKRWQIYSNLKPKELFSSNHINLTSEFISRSIFDKFARLYDLTTFTFVRHPFERLVSCYNDKMIRFDLPRSFSGFVARRVLNETFNRGQDHWMPFVESCNHCDVPYNVIGRAETFDEDVKYIILKNNLDKLLNSKATMNSHIHQSKHDTKTETIKYFAQLNKTQIQRLYKKYRMDFELFGYDIDIYLNENNK